MTGCIAPRCSKGREPGSLFCRTHEGASAAQRGGWLSAERRRRIRGASVDTPLDASNIARRLWVGSKPPFDRDMPGFQVLVLAAQEIQPERLAFTGQIVRCPLPDGPLTDYQIRNALMSARSVATALRRGQCVLSTCQAGLNRSALIAALSLGMVTKMDSAELVTLVRQRRSPNALFNPDFVAIIDRFYARSRRG